MNMNNSFASTEHSSGSSDTAKFSLSNWSEEDIEEIHAETPWEIFSSEIDNWAAINIHSADF